MPTPLIEDPLFEELIDPTASIERLGGDGVWAEGPAWIPSQQAVIWSDIPNNRIMRWTEEGGVEVDRTDVEFTNGRTLDLEGRLVVCSHGHRRIERAEPDGTITPLATHYEADGFRVDRTDHVFTSAEDGIHVLTPEGRRIGKIPLPEVTSNCAFGGPEGNDLLITASTALYRVRTKTTGASRPLP